MLDSHFSKRIIWLLTLDSPRSYQVLSAVLILTLISLSLVLIGIGLAPIRSMPWDVMVMLDGGWRIINGQIPHIDYYNPIGPFYTLLTALGMKIAAPSASSLVYGNVLACSLLTPLAWFVARDRLSALNTFLFTLLVGILLIAPRALGSDIFGLHIAATSYAMLYNKQGFVLLSILMVELLLPPRKSQSNKILSGFLSGSLLALLLFCKITYFIVGAATILVYLLLSPSSPSWLTAFAGGFLGICIAMQVFFHISVPAMISDLKMAGQSQSIAARLTKLKRVLKINLPYIYLGFSPLTLLAVMSTKVNRGEARVGGEYHFLFAAFFVILSGLFICVGNAQDEEIPLFFIAGLILLEQLDRNKSLVYSTSELSRFSYLFGVLIVLPIFCVNTLIRDIGSIIYSASWNLLKRPLVEESQRFHSKTLSDFIVPYPSELAPTNEGFLAQEYPAKINDGLALLRRSLSSNKRIFVMDVANPFSFALEWSPPRGDALFWWNNSSFNRQVFPSPNQIFQAIDVVMVPKSARGGGTGEAPPYSEATEPMKEVYGDYLSQHFVEQDNSSYWTLWVRRAARE